MNSTTRDERRPRVPDSQIKELFDCGRSSSRMHAHELDRDPGDLQLALARGAQSARIDDRTAGELIAAAGLLLDLPLLLGPP